MFISLFVCGVFLFSSFMFQFNFNIIAQNIKLNFFEIFAPKQNKNNCLWKRVTTNYGCFGRLFFFECATTLWNMQAEKLQFMNAYLKKPLLIFFSLSLSLPFTLCFFKTHILSRFQCPYYYLVIPQPFLLSMTNSLLRSTAVIGSKPQSNKASSRCSD